MSAIFRLTNRTLLQRCQAINQTLASSRAIKTSPKKDDTVCAPAPVTKEDFANPSTKNWVSFGFDTKNQTDDRNYAKSTMFFSITLCMVVGTFVWAYMPDMQLKHWAQREAFLELRRREEAGLDLVSPNYVDPAQIVLPSEEDLGDTEIII